MVEDHLCILISNLSSRYSDSSPPRIDSPFAYWASVIPKPFEKLSKDPTHNNPESGTNPLRHGIPGLIRLTHTRQNRGTTEKYYEAIAREFRAGADLFSNESSDDQKSALRPMIQTVFDNTTSELLRLVDADQTGLLLEDEGVLSYIEMHLTQEQIYEVQQKLKDVLDHLQSFEDPETAADKEGLRKYRLTMAYYPLDRID